MPEKSLKELIKRKDPLPKDINSDVEKASMRLFGEDGTEPIKRWRIKRLFNKVTIIAPDKVTAMECNFRGGVCTNYHLQKKTEKNGLIILEDRNILNKKVTQN